MANDQMPPIHTAEDVGQSKGLGWTQGVQRVRVNGGWLYISQCCTVYGVGVAQTFIPDTTQSSE